MGRVKLQYETIEIRKTVPKEIYAKCMALLYDELCKFKNKEFEKKNVFSASN